MQADANIDADMMWKASPSGEKKASGGVTTEGADLLKGLSYILSSKTMLIVSQTSILQFNKQ